MADRVVFFSAVAFIFVCGVLMGAIALFGPNPQPPPIATLFETLKYLFTVGGLGLLTLFGGLRRTPQRKKPDVE